MITDKNEAIAEVGKDNPNFKNIDEYLLSDKDVALTYMQHHSSNTVLVSKFPINIDNKGMIDDEQFMLNVINCLSNGYDEEGLNSLLKYSANCIVRARLDSGEVLDTEHLKQIITDILTQYHNAVKARDTELSKKEQMLKEMEQFIEEMPNLNNKPTRSNKRYARTNIGFTAEF